MKNANNKEIKIYIDNNDVEETYGEIINFTITQNGNYQDMYCIKSNLLTLTILTDELDLYDTSLKGLSVIVENVTDNVVMFRGVISQTPAAQPYNYEKESFTLYAVDKLRYVLMNTELTESDLQNTFADGISFYDGLNAYFNTYGYSLNSIPFWYYPVKYRIPHSPDPDDYTEYSIDIDILQCMKLTYSNTDTYRYQYIDANTRYSISDPWPMKWPHMWEDYRKNVITWEDWLNSFCQFYSLQLVIDGDVATFSNPCTTNTSINTTTAHYADTNKGLNDAVSNVFVKQTYTTYDADANIKTSIEDLIDDNFFTNKPLHTEVAWNFPLGVQLSAFDSSSVWPTAQRFGLTREPYSAWNGYVFKNKWGDGQDTSDFYSRYQPYLQHDDTGRWEGFTAEQYVTYYKTCELDRLDGVWTETSTSTYQGILIATDVSTISMNDERVTDKRWINGDWITVADDSSNYPLLFRNATFYDIDTWPAYDSSTMLPANNIQYKKRLLVTPPLSNHLYVGYDNRTLGYKKAFAGLEEYAWCKFRPRIDKLNENHNKYFLIAKLDLEMITNQNSGTFNDLPDQKFWSNGNANLKYLSRKGASYDIVFNRDNPTYSYFDDEYIWKWEITDEPFMLCDIFISMPGAPQKGLYNQKIYIKCDNENILGELHEIDNTNWTQDLGKSGYIVYQFSDEEAALLSQYPYTDINVRFFGVGNFGGRLFTNTVSFAEGQSGDVSTLLNGVKELSMLEYISWDNNPQYDPMFRSPSTFEGAEISIDKYLINFSFEICTGHDGATPTRQTEYKDSEITEIANVNGLGPGVLDVTFKKDIYVAALLDQNVTYKGWNDTATREIIDVEKKVDGEESWYTVAWDYCNLTTAYGDVYNINPFKRITTYDLVRLATYADQFTTPSIVLDLTSSTNDQFIDFESTRYRLVSYNYDGVRDLYKNKYIQLKDLTSIQYDNTSTNN